MTDYRMRNAGACWFLAAALTCGCAGEPAKSPEAGNGDSSPATQHSHPHGAPGRVAAEGRDAPETTVDAEPLTVDAFPLPAGAEIIDTIADTQTIMMRGPNQQEEFSQHFEARLGELGWQKNEETSETIDGVGFLEFNKGELTISITMNPDLEGDTMMLFAQGDGLAVPEDAEHDFGDDVEPFEFEAEEQEEVTEE